MVLVSAVIACGFLGDCFVTSVERVLLLDYRRCTNESINSRCSIYDVNTMGTVMTFENTTPV